MFLFVLFNFMQPIFFKRLIFPRIYGTDYLYQDISEKEYFEDVNSGGFILERNGKKYQLVPKVKYSVTGRVGIMEHYDTWFGKFFRGYFQGDYINLAPRDALIVTGNMAKNDVFKNFNFKHEERGGYVLCKGVKYRTHFYSAYKNEEEALKSEENYKKCQPFLKIDEYNNYHLIPVNDVINKALSMLRHGDVVSLYGFLVDVPEMNLSTGTRKGQKHNNLITNGMNPGKCFILYTDKVVINNIVYE
ncbi:MAG: hypothetical protein MJ250_06750 [Alphaproteobacteria bacterium]|nr:hypothetical protein [Alphaproteobacteria bacterium]